MGIGYDTMKGLIAAVAGDPNARAELADAVNLGNEGIRAHDLGNGDAKNVFADQNRTQFEVVRTAEVAKRLEEVINPKKREEESPLLGESDVNPDGSLKKKVAAQKEK